MIKDEAKKRIAALTKEIDEHNYYYYVLDNPLISDYEFDLLMKQLEQLEKDFPEFLDINSPTQRVGGEVAKEFVKVKHKYPMLSLGNTYSWEEVLDFDKKVRNVLGNIFDYVYEPKYDGLSIGITYINGILAHAVTRGNGEYGDNVTTNVKTIKSIPLKLHGIDFPEEFEIRGEIVMPYKSFERLNKEREEIGEAPFANPRNAASGSIKMLDSSEVAKRGLDCVFYSLLGNNLPWNSHYDRLLAAKNWGFKISNEIQKISNIELEKIHDLLIKEEKFITSHTFSERKRDFEIDGAVIKINSIKHQEMLSYTAKIPKWAIAYKYKAEQVSTKLLSIDFQVGRTGAITPVANLEPVHLAGTIVKRASLHNADQIEKLNLHNGDYVFVEKGGEIIPKIISVDESKRDLLNAEKVEYISKCPECGTILIRNEGEAIHYCPNDTGCAPQIKGKLEHFISKKAMNIESLGEGKIELLFDSNIVKNPLDLYNLTYEKIFNLEKSYTSENSGKIRIVKFKEKTVQNILKGIEESKKVPFETVLYALGIRYVGETVAKKLAFYFLNIDALISASIDELINVEEIGIRIAESIIVFFNNKLNLDLINNLKINGLQFEVNNNVLTVLSNNLNGKSFVVSGIFENYSRDQIKKMIEENGGKNTSTVSSKTNFLLAGESVGPEKMKKAQAHNISVISENEFLKMIE